MATQRITVRGPAHVDQAWARYERLDHWPEWAPHITAVQANASSIAPGVTGTVHGPGSVRVAFTIDSVDRNQHVWVWRVHVGPLHLVLEHDLVASPGGVRAGLTLHGPSIVVLPYLPLATWALRRLTRRP